MHRLSLPLILSGLGCMWLAGLPTAQAQNACDRQCLESMAEAYLSALVRRDPGALPLANDVKFTENGQTLVPGDGLWHTVTGRGRYALPITDIAQGQIAWMGTVREAGMATILVIRLGIRMRLISEIETLVIRDQPAAERLEAVGAPREIFFETVPEHERHSRSELVRIANEYFSGIERNDGRGDYPIADDCARLENGMVTAGDPRRVISTPAPLARELERAGRLGCREQFETGMFYYVTSIRDRRFTVLDPERGLAFAFAFFDNAGGDARFGTLSDGREVESGPSIPWTWQIAEVFRIEHGIIGPVESVLHSVPYGMGSGWSNRAAAMSSEPFFR